MTLPDRRRGAAAERKMTMAHKIEWLNPPGYKGETWNPVTGCSPVSDGCKNCYARRMAHRLSKIKNSGYYGMPDPFKVTLRPEKLDIPLHWRKPRWVFPCSMSDLFHPNVPEYYIYGVMETIEKCPDHIFILLTKRAERMKKMIDDFCNVDYYVYHNDPLPNLILGVTVENQKAADERIPLLLKTPAAYRVVSFEPLLGPVELQGVWNSEEWWCKKCEREVGCACVKFNETHDGCGGECGNAPVDDIDWVIVGGETGPGARPMHPEWVESIRLDCDDANVSFFFKQWGEWYPDFISKPKENLKSNECVMPNEMQSGYTLFSRIGKRRAGRFIRDRLWEEFPEVKPLIQRQNVEYS